MCGESERFGGLQALQIPPARKVEIASTAFWGRECNDEKSDENVLWHLRKLAGCVPHQHIRLVCNHFLGVPRNEICSCDIGDGWRVYRHRRSLGAVPGRAGRSLQEEDRDVDIEPGLADAVYCRLYHL